MDKIDAKITALKDELINIRQELHQYPEVGFQEYQTAAKVAFYMQKLGLEVVTGVGKTGVIGLLKGGQGGPTIALRACLDALAMDERSGVDYTSENTGVFHGCGHDGNMTMVLGAANILSQYRQQLKGNVKFIFQPAEEETGGAAEIIKAGGLDNPSVDAIITLHNWHGLKEGLLSVKPGPILASSDLFHLEIIGKPGHGAYPHLAVDPIVAAADVISALQNIVSREIDPMKTSAITIGMIHGGTAVNVIPEMVAIDGTVRTFENEVRDFIENRMKEIVRGVTQAARARYTMEYRRIMPPVDNDQTLAAKVTKILTGSFPPGMVINQFDPQMGCEEFSLFQEKVPGLFLFIGNDKDNDEVVPIHDPGYIFNDEILTIGVKALCAIALEYSDRME